MHALLVFHNKYPQQQKDQYNIAINNVMIIDN